MEKLRKSLKKAKEASKPPDAMMPYSSTAQGRKRPTINPRTKNPDVGKNFSLGIQPYYQNTAPADDDSLVEITSAERERQPKTRKSKLEKIKQLQAYNHDLKVKQSELKQDVRNLTKQCRDIQRSSTIQLSSLEIQMNELKSELHKAKQKNKFQEPTEEQLDGRLLAIQALKQATQKQENRIVRLKGDLERRRYQSRAKDDRIHDLEKELVELKEKNTKSRQEFDSNQTEMAGLLRELTKAKDDYEQLQEEHEAWESERKQMQRNLRASTSQLLKEKSLRNIESIEKKGEEDNLQAMLTQKIEKITELKQDLERAEDELLEEREKNSKKELEIQTKLKIELRREYDEKLRIKESEIVLLKEEKEKSRKQNESVRSENEAMNERLNWLMEDSDRLRNELDEQAAAAKEDLARQKKEIEEKAAAETVAQVAAATAALEKQTGKVSTEVVKLQDEKIARLKEERDNSEKQNESLRSENQAMNEKVITLMKKSDNLKNELDENSAAAAKELARLRQELKEVASADTAAAIAAFEKESKKENEEKLKLKETEITRLKEEREDSEKQNERLRLDNKGMHERMSNLMKESDRLKKERDENATTAADSLARLRKEFKERISALNAQVSLEKENRKEHEEQLKINEAEISRLKKEKDNNEKQNEILRTDNKGMQEKVSSLIEESDRLKKEIEERSITAKEDLARQRKELKKIASAETAAAVAAATAKFEEESKYDTDEKLKLKEAEIAKLKEERDDSERQNESLRIDNETTNERLYSLIKERDNLKIYLDKQSITAKEDLARLRKEMEENNAAATASALAKAAEESDHQKKEMNKRAVADTAAAIAAFEKESKKENEEKLKLKETEITRLKEERDDSEKQNERLRLDNEGMHERMSNLMKESDRLKKERDENATIAADNLARLRTELEERTAAAVKQVDSKGTQTDSNPSEEKGAESDVLKKELENLRTWAKAALQNVQRLEEDKAAAKKHTDTLEKKLAEMESQLLPQGVSLDDQSSIGSNTLMNYMRGDVDDDATISSTIDYDDASVNSNTHRKRGFFRKGAQSENGDKIITISEGEMFVKEEKIKSLQVAKNRHEKTIGNLVKEVMKLRKVQKEASLQMQSLQHEREAFKMKIAVLEKEFAIMEINTTANTQSEVAAKFQRASRLGSSGFVAETTTQLELRVKDQKISALEKLINEDKQLLSSIRSEMAALRVDAQKETKRHMQEIEKLRRENISFFQQVKILEKEKKDVENQLDEKKNEEKEIDESGLENITDGQSIRIIRELNKKIRDRDKKIDALKKYNEMMEKTVAQLRTEYMNLRSTLRSEANQSKLEIEKLKNEKDIEVSKVSAFEKELSEFKKIQEGSLEGKIDSSDKKKLVSQITESRQSIKMLKAEISSITSMKEMEIDSLRKEILKLGREKNDLEKDMIQHLGQLDEVKLQLNSTSGELNFLKNQLDSVEEEKILMEEDFQSKLDDQEEKMSHLEATVLKLRESNLNQHEAMMKRDKKKKKKKDKEKKKIKSPLSLMSSRKSNSAKLIDDDAAAKLLEQMMLNDVNEADADFIRRLNQDAQDMLHEESDFDSNLDTENEYGVDTDNDTVSEDGYRHYSKNMVVYDKILPNSSHDAYDSDIPLSTDESDNEYSLPMRHGRNLLGDRTSEEDDDSMYGSLHMQPMNLHSI